MFQGKTILLILSFFLTATICNISTAADEAVQLEGTAANWELKGLRLGASIDQVKAALPSAECDTKPFDAGLTTCMDYNNTLADQKAVVMVKLLEGRVVYIDIGNINLEQARAAATALAVKYGPAGKVLKVEGQTSAANRDRNIWTDADRYTWTNGDILLQVNPFAWTDKKRRVTYAAVVLLDTAKHDRKWLIRYKSQGKKAADI